MRRHTEPPLTKHEKGVSRTWLAYPTTICLTGQSAPVAMLHANAPAITTAQMPTAETERLIVREIDGETLVYDRRRNAASCLNEFATRVWRECDGETSVAEIAAAPSNWRCIT